MTDTSKVLRFLERAAARADGRDDDDPPPESETLAYTRFQLTEAAAFAHAGEEIPSGARLRPMKQAMVAVVRPVTSNQRAYNEAMLSAVDGMAATADRLAHQLILHDQRTARLQAGVATTDLTVDDLNDDVRRLRDQVEGLAGAVDELRAELAGLRTADLAALRSELAVVQSKQDLIFRAARQALPLGDPAGLEALAGQLTSDQLTLRDQIAEAFRGTRDQVKSQVDVFLADISATTGSGPVLDLAPGRGEWLELLRDNDTEAYGVDPSQHVVTEATQRGLRVVEADPLTHLRELPEGSVRAVTAFGLADRLDLDSLTAIVDAALIALAPGGLLLIDAPNPTNVTVGAGSAWRDPRVVRPLHPDLVEWVAMARGFAQAEVRYSVESNVATLSVEDLATVDDDPARAQALVERVNWALAGPLRFAVLARKAALVG
ncbi:MAG: methyltransferase domain-containing protein [Aquihabitans sp.]